MDGGQLWSFFTEFEDGPQGLLLGSPRGKVLCVNLRTAPHWEKKLPYQPLHKHGSGGKRVSDRICFLGGGGVYIALYIWILYLGILLWKAALRM